MSDGKPVRATTADEEAVMFQQSWVKAEREANRLRAENEKLRAALKPLVAELDDCPNDDYEHALVSFSDLRAAAAALKETGDE